MLLLDASVWVASVDPKERFHRASHALVGDFKRPVAALDLTLYEVANVLGARRRRQEIARDLCEFIPGRTEGVLAVDQALISSAIDIALNNGLSAYDAAYVAATRLNGWTLVSLDGDLVSPGLAALPEDA